MSATDCDRLRKQRQNIYTEKVREKNAGVLNYLIRRQIPVSLDLMEKLKLSEFAGFATKLLKKIYFTIYKKNILRYTAHLEQIPCAPTQLLRITKAKVL